MASGERIGTLVYFIAAPLKERKGKRLGFSKPVIKQGAKA